MAHTPKPAKYFVISAKLPYEEHPDKQKTLAKSVYDQYIARGVTPSDIIIRGLCALGGVQLPPPRPATMVNISDAQLKSLLKETLQDALQGIQFADHATESVASTVASSIDHALLERFASAFGIDEDS